jgi:thiosulfate reductase cytochrome b subunit
MRPGTLKVKVGLHPAVAATAAMLLRRRRSDMQRIYVHPLPVRIWHWINAFGFVAMIVTGIQIRYVDLVDLMSFETAVNLHNWIGFVLIGNFFIWFLFYLFSDKIKVYHPELSPVKHYRDSFRQLQYYGYGIFKGDPNPHHVSAYHKFNPMQSMMYQIIMLLIVPLQFCTGLLLWDVKGFSGAVELLGGVRVVDTVHVLIFIFFTSFIIIHVYLASLGHTPTAHFKAMITGYDEIDEAPDRGSSQ